MKESQIQRKIIDKIREEFGTDAYIFKVPAGPYLSRRGIPDLIACIHGLFVAIEVKTPTGKLSKLQDLEINKIGTAGGMATVVYGVDHCHMNQFIDEVKEMIRAHEL